MSLHGHHEFSFVLLSLVVAVLGSWTALDLFRRVRSHIGRTQRIWLAGAALAMGASIWSMHFIAMLGFDPGSPVSYDLPLTFLSLALAIGATLGAFFAAAKEGAPTTRVCVAGVAMGCGICLMHYVGMAALRTAISVGYRPSFVVASFVIAIAASTAALFAARRERSMRWRIAAAVILGMAIVGMHYTAMAGLKLTSSGAAAPLQGAPPFVLGAGVAAGSVLILSMALLASLYDERVNVLSALEAGGVGYWELSLPDSVLHVSARGKEILGLRADQPFAYKDLDDLMTPQDIERRRRLLAHALAEGGDYDAEYQLNGGSAHERWINIRGRVVARRGGAPRRMAGVVLDVTDRRVAFAALAHAEERQRLLIDELNHRVKNTLATVQAIARQTGRSASSIEGFREAFEGRVIALSRTHNALTQGGWETGSLRELLRQELSPYAPAQVRLSGEDLQLGPRQTLRLGMVFHELATNAAKYGALSTPDGRVEVEWGRAENGASLWLAWRETGGPAVAEPGPAGFGSRLIRSLIEKELLGEVALDFPRAGVVCRMTVPLRFVGDDLRFDPRVPPKAWPAAAGPVG
jgi:NO-binding membrane sensor protein with MHYT domain/two-component sensor histidine kinase